MRITKISISKTRTILVDGVFDQHTKYVKIGVTMDADIDEDLDCPLGVVGEVRDCASELSALVDDAIRAEVKKLNKKVND
jgi:hypothetical protein